MLEEVQRYNEVLHESEVPENACSAARSTSAGYHDPSWMETMSGRLSIIVVFSPAHAKLKDVRK